MNQTAESFDVVTGAFSFTGRYIAARLMGLGREVRTITGHPGRRSADDPEIEAFPYSFHDLDALTNYMEGAHTLYNTYWVRFPRRDITFDSAVANTGRLVETAKRAGVQRIVHISVMYPSADSQLAYFRGKAGAEQFVVDSGLEYTIVRPGLIYGPNDIFLNNIAWMLRRFPIFAIPGKGDYLVQPVYVDDVARLCVEFDGGSQAVTDAAGPETYRFDEFVSLIANAVGSSARMVRVPPGLALAGSKLIGALVRDVVLTKQELVGLMTGLCFTHQPLETGKSFKQWLSDHGSEIGLHWASQIERHYKSSPATTLIIPNESRARSKAAK